VLTASVVDGVARVRAALIAQDPIGRPAQGVDDLAFAFVAPLGTYYYNILCHIFSLDTKASEHPIYFFV
jgi:hypothetical protein